MHDIDARSRRRPGRRPVRSGCAGRRRWRPMWPIATTASTPSPRSRSASALIAAIGSTTWYGPRAPGKTRFGMSGLENPTMARVTPSTSNVADGCQASGVAPDSSARLADRYGNSASGDDLVDHDTHSRLSKLWLPRPPALKPIEVQELDRGRVVEEGRDRRGRADCRRRPSPSAPDPAPPPGRYRTRA